MSLSTRKFAVRLDDGRHRQATWLELFFDLAFVISVAALSHILIEAPSWSQLGVYVALLAPVWWLWNQFTWYVSHFDNDDRWFRIIVLSAIAVTVFLSTTLHGVIEGHASTFVVSYLILHAILVVAWMRAYAALSELRPYALWKLAGIIVGSSLWASSLFLRPPSQYFLWVAGFCLQLSLPILAWHRVHNAISIHYRHISERHGLFTIIILGETLVVLAAGLKHPFGFHTLLSAVPAFVIIASIWWIYFDWDYETARLASTKNVFAFNYGHFFVYAAIGSLAAGIALMFAVGVRAHEHLSLLGRMLIAGSAAAFLAALATMNVASYGGTMWKKALPRFAIAALLVAYAAGASALTAAAFTWGTAALLLCLIVFEAVAQKLTWVDK